MAPEFGPSGATVSSSVAMLYEGVVPASYISSSYGPCVLAPDPVPDAFNPGGRLCFNQLSAADVESGTFHQRCRSIRLGLTGSWGACPRVGTGAVPVFELPGGTRTS